jgi:glycosyltransferase involved in cell wall biosynthesis
VRVRPYNLIRQLAEKGHVVTVLAACASDREHADAVALQRHCARVETVRIPFQQSLWNCARGIAQRLPLQAVYSYSPAFARQLDAEVEGAAAPYDVLHIEHLRAVLCGMRVTSLPRVYDSVDCISRLFEKTLQMSATPLSRLMAFVDLNRTRRFEGNLVGRFERILMASASDKASLAALGRQYDGTNAHSATDSISVIPNGVDLEYFAPHDAPRAPATLVFVGRMSYHANVAAVLYMGRSDNAETPHAPTTAAANAPISIRRPTAATSSTAAHHPIHARRPKANNHVASVPQSVARVCSEKLTL